MYYVWMMTFIFKFNIDSEMNTAYTQQNHCNCVIKPVVCTTSFVISENPVLKVWNIQKRTVWSISQWSIKAHLKPVYTWKHNKKIKIINKNQCTKSDV